MQIQPTKLLGGNEVCVTFTDKPVTPWGGLVLLSAYWRETGVVEVLERLLPFTVVSPNALKPVDIAIAFMGGVITGMRRLTHFERLRHDYALAYILGINRFPSEDTFSRFLKRFNQKAVNEFFCPLFVWQLDKIAKACPALAFGCTLDLDSSVVERYGHQEGAVIGYNPRKHRRPSHHPIFATLGELPVVVHAWLRPGNTSSARGAVEFIKEAAALLPKWTPLNGIRADSGFASEEVFGFLESQKIRYAIAARFTRGMQNAVSAIKDWQLVDEGIFIAETVFEAQGWSRARRVIVVKERTPKKDFVRGRELFNDPAYAYQAVITDMQGTPTEIWRYQRGRADIENRLRELKWDYGMDGFCLSKFYATEAALRLVCFAHNSMAMFERRLGYKTHRTLGTLRSLIFACGAILGAQGRKTTLRLSLGEALREQFARWLESFSYCGKGNCAAVESG
ncbi:MAG: IS1380 family transposase [Candidatus Paceibacterota bacterium]